MPSYVTNVIKESGSGTNKDEEEQNEIVELNEAARYLRKTKIP